MLNGEANGTIYIIYLESGNIYNIQRITTNSQRRHVHQQLTQKCICHIFLRYKDILIDKWVYRQYSERVHIKMFMPVIISGYWN